MQSPQWTHSWKLRYSILRVNQSRSIPAACTCTLSVAVTRHRPVVPQEKKNSDSVDESPGVQKTFRVERLLDTPGQGPVGPGTAPDFEPPLPLGRTAGHDHATAVISGQEAELLDIRGRLIERPFPHGMQTNDPVARVRLHGPPSGIDVRQK